MYDPELTQPMEDELVDNGVVALKTKEDVLRELSSSPDCVVFINSVCGCSAGTARPSLMASLKGASQPKIFTVFAGVDAEATDEVRRRLGEVEPSSPSIAFFKMGKAVFLLGREKIEVSPREALTSWLLKAYEKFYSEPLVVREDVELDDLAKVPELSPKELKKMMDEGEDVLVVDCRASKSERAKAVIEGSVFIDDAEVQRLIEHPTETSPIIVCHCHFGHASGDVVRALLNHYGLKRVYNLKGGIDAWSQEVDPAVARY